MVHSSSLAPNYPAAPSSSVSAPLPVPGAPTLALLSLRQPHPRLTYPQDCSVSTTQQKTIDRIAATERIYGCPTSSGRRRTAADRTATPPPHHSCSRRAQRPRSGTTAERFLRSLAVRNLIRAFLIGHRLIAVRVGAILQRSAIDRFVQHRPAVAGSADGTVSLPRAGAVGYSVRGTRNARCRQFTF